MKTDYLAGLIKARQLLAYGGGLAQLDELIAEQESRTLETASIVPETEKR